MNFTLTTEIQELIEQRLKSGKYGTPEEVVTIALRALGNADYTGDFKPGEWDRLLAEGEQSGEALDGDSVLDELRQLRSARPTKAG